MTMTHIAVVIFAAVFLILLAVFLIAYDRLARRNRRLRERMRNIVEQKEETPEKQYLILRDQSYSHIPFLDRLLSRFASARRLQEYIDQAGLPIRAGALILASLSLASVAGLGATLLTGSRFLGIVLVLVVVPLPFFWLTWRRAKRIDRFEELLPEAIDLTVNALKSGFSLESSLSLVAQEMPDPVGPEFAVTYEEQNLGVDFVQALDNMTRRVPSDDLRIMTTAISIQRRTGGNLAEILGLLARMIRERFLLRREMRIHTAQGRLSGAILILLPFVLAVMIQIMNKDYLKILFEDPVGMYLVVLVIILQAIGILTIRRIVRLRY
ncbi:MAG: type II secretion system F family protein [candidate division Zixibacteria bacterium]|nr:type II secretion system F family protein [candidate division Zixibacteria bacterium]